VHVVAGATAPAQAARDERMDDDLSPASTFVTAGPTSCTQPAFSWPGV